LRKVYDPLNLGKAILGWRTRVGINRWFDLLAKRVMPYIDAHRFYHTSTIPIRKVRPFSQHVGRHVNKLLKNPDNAAAF
jgi:hypothetical protein